MAHKITFPSSARHLLWTLAALLVLSIWNISAVCAQERDVTPRAAEAESPAARARLRQVTPKLPLSFEANMGQTDARVKFFGRGDGYHLFLTADEAVLALSQGTSPLRIALAGRTRNATIVGLDELPGRSNYFVGGNPAAWRANVPRYRRVRYAGAYEGIDLVYYANQGQLEYDFHIAPGADPSIIRLAFTGADDISIDGAGDLVLRTPAGHVRQRKPDVYQEVDGARRDIAGRFVKRGPREVGFEVGTYDRSQPLVIDPVLFYSSYLGGGSWDFGTAIAVDAAGMVYVTGWTDSISFPTKNTIQPPPPPHPFFPAAGTRGQDVFVTKIDPSAIGEPSIVYSTYLGGFSSDEARGIAVDAGGHAYITGWTISFNQAGTPQDEGFPVTADAFQRAFYLPLSGQPQDAFLTKLSAEGNALVYSTYLGGNSVDVAEDIALDAAGHVFLTGRTESTSTTAEPNGGFPVTPGAFQSTNPMAPNGGQASVFVAKFDLSHAGPASLAYSTYLGGTGSDFGKGIAVDANGEALVAGDTTSVDFPMMNALQPTHTFPRSIGFVTKLSADGTALRYSTYLGTARDPFFDSGLVADIDVDTAGHAYVTGSAPPGVPTTPDAFQPALVIGAFAAFVVKLDTTESGAASLLYGTYVTAGAPFADSVHAIAVDPTGSASIVGTTRGPFPTTADAVSRLPSGDGDVFVAKLNATATSLVYSTYLGGSGTDVGRDIAVDANGNMYVTGETVSTNFPVVSAYQPVYGGSLRDAFVAVIGRPMFTISGEVLDRTTSAPVPGVSMALSGSPVATATTDLNGSYSFALPSEATYTVTPSLAGYTFAPPSRTFADFGGNEFGDFTAIANGGPDPDPEPGEEILLPPGSRLKVGDIEVHATQIVQVSGSPNTGTDITEDGVYRLTGSVNLNVLVFLEGEIEVTLDKALKKLAFTITSGHIYLADIPPFGKMTMWRGAGITFTVDGINKKINDLVKKGLERMPLKLAGSKVGIDTIKLHFGDDPGVEITGVLEFPPVFGATPLTAAIESLLISKKHGPRFGGQIKVEKIDLGAFKINKVLLKYTPNYSNPALDVFQGEGDLTTPAFQVIGKVTFIGGALDSASAAIKKLSVKVPITPATPVLFINGGELSVGGLRQPPFFILLSVDLIVGHPELEKILTLSGASIKYTYPAKLEGSAALTLFTVKVAKAFLGIDAAMPNLSVAATVTLVEGFEVLILSADFSAGRKVNAETGEVIAYVEGGAKGIVQIPDGIGTGTTKYTGFPFDLLKGLGMPLPQQILSGEISYRNEELLAEVDLPLIGKTTVSVKNERAPFSADDQVQYDALKGLLGGLEARSQLGQLELGDLRNAIYNGVNVSVNEARLGALKAELSVLATEIKSIQKGMATLVAKVTKALAKIATNFFKLIAKLGRHEFRIINAAFNTATRDQSETVGSIEVPTNAPKIIVRLEGEIGAPRFSLVLPDGTVLSPDSSGAGFVQNFGAKVSYFVVNDPAPGEWTIEAEDPADGPFVLDAWGANAAPIIDMLTAAAAGDNVTIGYSALDADDVATASLYYDTDQSGFNGQLIAQGLSESLDGRYIWNTTADQVASGDYYVYAVMHDGANAPVRRYASALIRVTDPLAPATPQNVVAQPGGENSLRVSWAANADPAVAGYNVRFSTTGADGHITTHVADAGPQTTLVLPSLANHTKHQVSVVAYTVSESPDPSSPTGTRIDVRMSLASSPIEVTTGTAVPPLVRVLSPNGGETIAGDSTITIAWEIGQGDDLLDQQIELSTDGGTTYHPLALRLAPERRSLEWDVPLALRSATTRLRVSALDRAGNEGVDASDADFIINGTASIPDVPVDVIPPSTTASLSPAPNEAGWHRASVNVSLASTDAGSGVTAITYSATGGMFLEPTTAAGASTVVPVTAEGTTTIAYVAVDNAGNVEETNTIILKVDTIAPSIGMSARSADGRPYASGMWAKHALIVSVNCSDGGSGVGSVSDAVTIDGEGAGQSAAGSCTDLAGNTVTTTFTGINIDKTAPSIQCGAADGAWHAGNVGSHCTASDGMSGLAHTGDSGFSLLTTVAAGVETADAQTDGRTVCDVAANCASVDSIGGNRVDRKPPIIAIPSPQADAAYTLNQSVAATYTCVDGGAGTSTCAGGVAPHGQLDTSSPREGVFTVSSTDLVGNSSTMSVSYHVTYGVRALYDEHRAHKRGSTIRFRVQLTDARGVNVSSQHLLVTALGIARVPAGAHEDVLTFGPKEGFEFDAKKRRYRYQFKTKGLAAGSYVLRFSVSGDPVTHVAPFKIR